MPRAKLTLEIPPETWIGDLSRTFPEARIRVLAALADEEAGVGLAELASPQLPDLVGQMNDYDSVTDLDLIQQYEEEALVQFETTMPLLLLAAQGSGIPLELPFEIENGEAVWEVTAPQDRLSELGDQLSNFGIPFTVEAIHQHVESEQLLTDRQRSLLVAAVENGYYDTPRDCSLTELAEVMDIAKSTCSETLHRAEEKVIKQFVRENEDVDV